MCVGMAAAGGLLLALTNTQIRQVTSPPFVDRLALTRFTLLGTSMGGIIAMTYAADDATD